MNRGFSEHSAKVECSFFILYLHLSKYAYHRKQAFLPSLHYGFTAPDDGSYKGVVASVQARKLVKLSRLPIVFGWQGIFSMPENPKQDLR